MLPGFHHIRCRFFEFTLLMASELILSMAWLHIDYLQLTISHLAGPLHHQRATASKQHLLTLITAD